MERRTLLLLFAVLLPFLGRSQIRSHHVTQSFDLPFESVYDLAWDGQDLWLSHDTGRISRIDPKSGRILDRMDTRMSELKGLAHDGEALWAAETEKGRIHRIEPSSGKSTEAHPSPAEGLTRPSGLAWDGEMLWNNDTRTVYCGTPEQDATFRFHPEKGTQKEFEGVRDCPFGLAFGGGHLWVGENSSHRIYMLDTADGNVVDSIEAPGRFINGLSYADGGLWVMTNGNGKDDLHRVEIELEEEKEYVEVHQKGEFFYPNPADDRLTIDLPENAPKGRKQLELYGSNGKRILVRSLEGRRDRIELPELPNGIHYLRVLNDGEIWRSSPVLIAQ